MTADMANGIITPPCEKIIVLENNRRMEVKGGRAKAPAPPAVEGSPRVKN